MASAEKTTVTREVVQTIDEDGVTLTLTMEEARLLAFILNSVGGHEEGPRGVADHIRNALIQITGWVSYHEFRVDPDNCVIYFAD